MQLGGEIAYYMKRFSIIHNLEDRVCLVCGSTQNIHIHEVFFGTANRKLSIKYGLCVCLCARHHNMSNSGVHFDKGLDRNLKEFAQKKFNEVYPELEFRKIFGKSYL